MENKKPTPQFEQYSTHSEHVIDALEVQDATYYDSSQVDFSAPMSEFIKKERPGIGLIPEKRQDWEKIIETPALEAILELYDKNIRTVSHDANSEQVGKHAVIWIDWNSLSEANQEIAQDMGLDIVDSDEGERLVGLKSPVSEHDTIGQVSQRLSEAQQPFVEQDILYGFEEVTEDYLERLADELVGYKEHLSGSEITIQEALSIVYPGHVYYEPENRVYAAEELLDKHLRYKEDNQ